MIISNIYSKQVTATFQRMQPVWQAFKDEGEGET